MPPGPKMVEDKCPPGPKRVPNIQNNGTEDKCPQALPLQTLRNTPGHTLEPVTYPPLPPPHPKRTKAPRGAQAGSHLNSMIFLYKMSPFQGLGRIREFRGPGLPEAPGETQAGLADNKTI